MLRRALLACLLVPLACGGKKNVAPAPPSAAAPAASDAAPAAQASLVPPTKEARRAYRKHLIAGRKHGAASEWGEALVEFEAALAAIPHDGRALSELAWAAFNSGDYDKARTAGREAVAAAGEPRLKAASLYNLGRVEEATARKEQAAKLYRESLALRPSKTVAEHLAGLGKEVADEPGAEAGLFCTEPRAADDLCPCVEAYAAAWDKDVPAEERSCELGDESHEPDFRIVHAQMSRDTEMILLAARTGTTWAIVAELEEIYSPGAFGISEDWKLVSIREEKLGERRVVKVVTEHHRTDSDAGIEEVESEDRTDLTLCVIGTSGPTTCPLTVPTAERYQRERLDLGGDDGDALDEETRKLQTPGLPIDRSTELRVDLSPDGGALVRLVKGSSDASLRAVLGPHRLW